MVNVNKLKGKIVENGMNIAELADKINMNRSTLYRKINGNGCNFLVKEVSSMAEILCLNSQDINEIFFASNVALNANSGPKKSA